MAVALDLAPLVALAVVTFLIMVLLAYRATFGALVDWLIAHIPSLHVGIPHFGRIDIFGWISGPLKALQNVVYATLAGLINAQHAVWNKFVQWNAYAWAEVSGAVTDLAHSTEQAFDYLVRHKIAAILLVTTGPLGAEILALKAALKTVPAPILRVIHETPHIVQQEVTKTTTRVVRITRVVGAAAVAAVAGEIAAVLPRLGRVERDLRGIDERLTRLAKRVAPAALVGAVAYALTQLGYSSTRCSPARRWEKALCGMHPSFLEGLLTDALVIASTISLVELARESQRFVGDVEAPLRLFVRELHNLPKLGGVNADAALARYAAGRF